MIKKSIRDAYGEALLKAGKVNKNVVALDADTAVSSKSIHFAKEFPDRFFNVGIAEANMTAMAAGLSTAGKIPFVNAFACFIMLRAADPVRSLIAYTKLNVKLAGTYCGMSDSYDGASHNAITDIAFMRSLPNMTVISVADAVETELAVNAAIDFKGPVYLRLSRADLPVLFDSSYRFEIGKGVQLAEGNDVSIIATGSMVYKALEASELLKSRGISARVVNIHTIKPIDKELIIRCARETGAIVTCEEHNIFGGLGGAVAEVLAAQCPVPMEYVAIQDTFAESGDYEQLLEKYGLSTENIVSKVETVLGRK